LFGIGVFWIWQKMFQILYGSTAAGLYDQAAKLNAQARTLYLQSSDTYYKANDGALLLALLYLRRCVSHSITLVFPQFLVAI
jgi:hypothetical protein